MISIPSYSASTFTGYVSDLFTDPGLLLYILVVAAIPFFFYVVRKLIALIPTDRDKELFEKAERSLKELGEKEKIVESQYVDIASAIETHRRRSRFHQ